jgi:hypothetical protein
MNAITNLLPARPSENASALHPRAACATVQRLALSWRIDPVSGRPVASWTIPPPPAAPWMPR